jgi:hypothetical protein
MAVHIRRLSKEEVTFLKKSNQKTFALGGCGYAVAKARRSRSFFASFFSKKEALTKTSTHQPE